MGRVCLASVSVGYISEGRNTNKISGQKKISRNLYIAADFFCLNPKGSDLGCFPTPCHSFAHGNGSKANAVHNVLNGE